MSRRSRFLKRGGGGGYMEEGGGAWGPFVRGRVNALLRTWAWGYDGVVSCGKCVEGLEN